MEEVMGLRYFVRYRLFGGTGEFLGLVSAILLTCGLSTTKAWAGGATALPPESLSVNTPTNTFLPQTQSTESGWLSGLHVSGYASQTFGMWQNPPALSDFTPSRNNLATSRTLLQVDENYRLNDANNFFARQWFVYEPPYSFNSANNGAYSTATPFHSSFGSKMNGYYNTYQVRDAWWENKTGPLTTFVGNQLVVWGQSLAFRVGDVVNPADTCWQFGFANLEQSRVPQWMVHPVLNLPEWGPTTSNFVELIVIPGFSPNYQPEQTGDPYNKYNSELTAGRVQPCFPAASHGPSARFDVHYTNIARFGPGGGGPISDLTASGVILTNPAGHLGWYCNNLPATLVPRPGWNPMPVGFQHPCNIGLSKQQGNYSPIGDGELVDIGYWHIPGMQPQNWNEGVRFHTLLGATELTALYYNDNTSGGSPWSARWTPGTNLWNYTFYDIQNAGVTADRPLPMPAAIAEYFPAVGRLEMVYSNHNSISDMRWYDFTGSAYTDVVKWMAAIDLDQAYAPWLTSTGNLGANIEVEDDITMDLNKTENIGNDVDSQPPKNDVSVLLNLGTSWWWSDFAPNFTMIYQPKGRNMAMFPSIVLNPPWTKRYFLKLQAIEVLGGANNNGLGLFKGESLLTAQLQYNFNLL
jgi:hypothetical protein